jgi:hypothetical protein
MLKPRGRSIFIFICLATLSVYGCASLDNSVPFTYSVPPCSEQPSQFILGLDMLKDNHPEGDKKATGKIDKIEELVTARLAEDLRSSRLFTGINFPSDKEKDTLIMRGEIKRFYWKMKPSLLAYAPEAAVILLFGIPAGYITGTAELKVVIINPGTGETLAE